MFASMSARRARVFHITLAFVFGAPRAFTARSRTRGYEAALAHSLSIY